MSKWQKRATKWPAITFDECYKKVRGELERLLHLDIKNNEKHADAFYDLEAGLTGFVALRYMKIQGQKMSGPTNDGYNASKIELESQIDALLDEVRHTKNDKESIALRAASADVVSYIESMIPTWMDGLNPTIAHPKAGQKSSPSAGNQKAAER